MVRIRLKRMGSKGKPFYRIVATPSTAARDGRFVEQLGTYDPLKSPAEVKVNRQRTLEFLKTGASPSETVEKLLKKEGTWSEWEGLKGPTKPRRKPAKARVKPPKPEPKPKKAKPIEEPAPEVETVEGAAIQVEDTTEQSEPTTAEVAPTEE